MSYRNLIIDMDDTLLPCGPFYVRVQNEFADFQAARTGLPRDLCLQVFKNIDLACTVLPDAFNKERFPRSFKAASLALDIIAGFNHPQLAAADNSYKIGHSVFDAPYDLFDGVRETLVAYTNAGFDLFLLTKGDTEIQQAKIDRNKLNDIIPESNVYIVPKKNGGNIIRIMAEHGLDSAETIVIGDSLRDDVGAAIEVGVDSVWVHQNSNKSWAYENAHENKATHDVHLFTDLPTIIPLSNVQLQSN